MKKTINTEKERYFIDTLMENGNAHFLYLTYRRINLRDSGAPIKMFKSKRRSPLFLFCSPHPPLRGWGLGLRAQTKSIRLMSRTNIRHV